MADETAATGTDAWAAQLTGSTAAVMRGGLWLARVLEEKYDATREAFAAGGIIEAQVKVIVKAGEQLPAQVTDEQRAVAEAALVAKAVDGMDARGLRQAARRMLAVISAELADVHEATQLEAEERRAEQETWMILEDRGDGTYFGKFVIPELHGQMLLASLERLSSPRRLANNQAGALVSDPTLPGDGPGLNRYEHLGFAFTELIEHLPTHGHADGVAATLVVHLDYDKLLDQVGSARLDTGIAISASAARWLACEAGIVPAVLPKTAGTIPGPRSIIHTSGARADAPTSPTASRYAAGITTAPTTTATACSVCPAAKSAYHRSSAPSGPRAARCRRRRDRRRR